MSMQDIKIYRLLPIINGYVQTTPNLPADKNNVPYLEALVAIPDAKLISLSGGSGRCTGSKFGVQMMIQLPGIEPGQSYYDYDSETPVDPVNVLKTPGSQVNIVGG